MQALKQTYRVFGELTIPIYFPTSASSKLEAIDNANQTISSGNVELVEGDIHTSDGKEHYLLAAYSNVRWIEAISKDDL